MGRSLVNTLTIKPPRELVQFLDDPPLVGEETPGDYYNLFSAIVISAKPADAIDWLYIKSVVDLTWEIRREQAVKASIIKLKQKEIVLELLKTSCEAETPLDESLYRIFRADDELRLWEIDSAARKLIDDKLAARGYPISEVLARAYINGASQIDAVDRRIASYEARRMTVLREIERRNEKFARQLEKASSDIIDAEFSEAAE